MGAHGFASTQGFVSFCGAANGNNFFSEMVRMEGKELKMFRGFFLQFKIKMVAVSAKKTMYKNYKFYFKEN